MATRAGRRNVMRLMQRGFNAWREQNHWHEANMRANGPARWKHTRDGHTVIGVLRIKEPYTGRSRINEVLLEHWRKFTPRTRCISRMIRELERATVSKHRHAS